MKRDVDLIRAILFEVEKFPEPDGFIPIEFEDHIQIEVSYHVKLLYQAGLIEAYDLSGAGSNFEWQAGSLTWEGHEFLDAARDDTRWNSTKNMIAEKVGSLPFEVLKQVLLTFPPETSPP